MATRKNAHYYSLGRLAVYNPRAAETVERLGFRSVRHMCLAHGLNICQVLDLFHRRIQLRRDVTGEYSVIAARLAQVTGCIPEDFVDDPRRQTWTQKSDRRTIQPANPSDDRIDIIRLIIEALPQRKREITVKSLLLGESFADLGRKYGISRERVRQDLDSALRKVRNAYDRLISRFGTVNNAYEAVRSGKVVLNLGLQGR